MTDAVLQVRPPLPPGAWLRPTGRDAEFPLEQPGCRWFARGRHALWHGVRALGLGAGDEVLTPAYHHGSEVEALIRAGVSCRFYAGDEHLAPSEEELDGLLGPRVRALLLIHYLGFPQDAVRWRRWCAGRGLLLLEDAAQAWLAVGDGRPVGATGDLAIFSLSKTVGVPDGALLTGSGAVRSSGHEGALGALGAARRHAAWLAGRSGLFARVVPRGASVTTSRFALGDPAARRSRATAFLVRRLAGPGVAAERRARYRVLLDELGERVPAPFATLPAGASPFAFPILADDRQGMVDRLRDRGVEAPGLWPAPHPALPATDFPDLAERRAFTVALPVHQELRSADLERIVTAVRGPARRGGDLRVEPIADPAAVRDEWTEIAERSGDPFLTWEWATTWSRHFLGGRRLRLFACRRPSGRLAAILPLYETARGPLRALRFVGSGPADRQGPVCAAEDRQDAARAIKRALSQSRCDVLLGERMPGDAAWGARIGAATLEREASPLTRIDGRSWDELLASRSSNFRQQVRSRERRVARAGSLQFRLAADPKRLPADLDTLVALHGARWRAGDSDALIGRRRAFHAEFAALALRRGWLRLWFLELDGRAVAAWYGFRYGDADWFYQSGRDPGVDELSVGFVLLAHTLRDAAQDGMRTYHLLRGDDPYKSRFATEDPGLETVGLATTAVGRAALAGASAAATVPAARRALVRLGG